jgi:hypothetical protein
MIISKPKEIEMHHVYLLQAIDIANERICEAARWRLAIEASRGETRRGFADRVREGLAALRRQPLARARLAPGTCDCR